MLIKLHSNATTTPRQRAYIQASGKSVAELTRELGVNESTIRRWKARHDTLDRTSRPHRLTTRFSAEEEEVAVELRRRRDCQDFRVRAGIMGEKESQYVPTQGAGDPG